MIVGRADKMGLQCMHGSAVAMLSMHAWQWQEQANMADERVSEALGRKHRGSVARNAMQGGLNGGVA